MCVSHTHETGLLLFYFFLKKIMDFYSSNRFFITLNLIFGVYSCLSGFSVYLLNGVFIYFHLPAWCLRNRIKEKFALWQDLNLHFSRQRKLLLSLVRLRQLGHCRWTQVQILLESAYFCLMGFFESQASGWEWVYMYCLMNERSIYSGMGGRWK